MSEFTICNFPHTAPEGYSYTFNQFNSKFIAIWLIHSYSYVYNEGKPLKTIWGFFNTKTKEYHVPVNSSKVGERVDITDTTKYTAMKIKQSPLDKFFL